MKNRNIAICTALCSFVLFAWAFIAGAQDTTPPYAVSAIASYDGLRVTVQFNEPVDELTADVFNYYIDDSSVALDSGSLSDPQTVVLTVNSTTPLQFGRQYCLYHCCAFDLAGNHDDSWKSSPIEFDHPPVVLSAVASCDGLSLTISYNEPVDPLTASDAFNYFFPDEQGSEIVIDSGSMPDSKTVILLINSETPFERGRRYTLYYCCVYDLAGNFDGNLHTIPIEFDTTPPDVSCSVAVPTLFAANNALVDVGFNAISSEANLYIQVYSDERAIPRLADATYENGILKLRARRDPGSDGRVYLIVVTSKDQCGNTGVCCTTVVIPQNGSEASLAAVQAQAATAQSNCSPSGAPSTPYLILP